MKTSGKVLAAQVAKIKDSDVFSIRSENLPTWCPGCGYFGIHQGINNAIQRLNIPHHKVVTVSGIGCAGRYPFFVNTYGLHTAHGRTLPVSTGVKLANPKLTVFAVSGDGDGLAIGGGHLPHAIRRNIDITYILFDNGIYGLTKGQTSPTTPRGQISKTYPYGNPDAPLNPMLITLSYGVTFAAKGYAGEPEKLAVIIIKAIRHHGFSFVHVISPCVTFDHENLVYERFRHQWLPVPADHDAANLPSAMALTMAEGYYAGVYYDRSLLA